MRELHRREGVKYALCRAILYKYIVLSLIYIYKVYTLSPTPTRVFGIFGGDAHPGKRGGTAVFELKSSKSRKHWNNAIFALAQRLHSGGTAVSGLVFRPSAARSGTPPIPAVTGQPSEGRLVEMTPYAILQTALGMLYAALLVTALVRLSAWLLRVLSKGRVDLRCSWRAGVTVTLFIMLSLTALLGLADLPAALTALLGLADLPAALAPPF